MSDKHPNPHQQQAPVHDSEEAQPGLDSLARTIGSGAHAETYRSGRRTHRPGSLKAPILITANWIP